MNTEQMKAAIMASITIVADAERILKPELAKLSRSIIEYIVVAESTDIATVNRLLSVLTPMNQQAASLYFAHFLPYQFDQESGKFGEMIKKQSRREAKIEASKVWLEDEANTIWAWANDNIEVKAKDYRATIQKAIKQALSGNDNTEALTVRQVLGAVLDTDGVELSDLVGFMGDITEEVEGAKPPAEQAAA